MTRTGVDLLVLAGGAATRLGSIAADTPKALLPVSGRPFIAYAIETMAHSVALRRVVFGIREGQSDVFTNTLSKLPYPFYFVEENIPMGTGGAILSAMDNAMLGDPFLVLNGDVIFDMDGGALLEAASRTGAAMAGIHVPDAARFGRIDADADGRVRAFREKTGVAGPGLVNAGAYAFTRAALQDFARAACSFETDIAPVLSERGILSVVLAQGAFLDIGTPETYGAADVFTGLQAATKQLA